jgi:hypothetical protein
MTISLTKTVTAAAVAGAIALTASLAPAEAAPILRGGGGFHGGGFHGGYGGFHRGYGGYHGGWRGGYGYGGWGWAPFAVGGLLAGAAIASAPYYYGGYYGNPCYRSVPTYDAYGNYVGRHWATVC